MAFPLATRESQRKGEWECIKEVLRWIINTKAGTVALPECKLQELRDLLDILTSQRHMGRKEPDRLVGKLCSMHPAVPGAVAQLYHIQRVLSLAGTDRAWLYPDFHLQDFRLEHAGRSDSRPAHSSRQDRLSQTHPSGVLQHLRTWGRGSMARSVRFGEGSGVAPPLAGRYHCQPSLFHEQERDNH